MARVSPRAKRRSAPAVYMKADAFILHTIGQIASAPLKGRNDTAMGRLRSIKMILDGLPIVKSESGNG
jgi:hypothetical protein